MDECQFDQSKKTNKLVPSKTKKGIEGRQNLLKRSKVMPTSQNIGLRESTQPKGNRRTTGVLIP